MEGGRSPLRERPHAYGWAFDAFAAPWTPARQALGRAILCWLIETPPRTGVKSRGPGDELEWRLITTDEWYAMRLALAEVIKHYPNDELITTVILIKDFHPTAYQHLSTDVLCRLRSEQAHS